MTYIVKRLPFILAAVTFLSFALPCRIRLRWKFLWLVVLELCAARLAVLTSVTGSMTLPDWPAWTLWLWDWAYCGGLLLLPLSLVWWGRRARHIVLPAIAWGVAALGVWSAAKTPAVRETVLEFEDLPAGLDGYRIVQLADFHASFESRRSRTAKIVEVANSLSPDLICLTGDNVDGSPSTHEKEIAPICGLRARDGVWAVSGNHEYYRRRALWRPAYGRLGIRFLENECVFPRKGLALGGVNDDAAAKYRFVSKDSPYYDNGPAADVAKTFAAATNGEFRVLMQHQPKHAPENISEHGVRLQISGHTHGGIVPLVAQLVKLGNGGFIRGAYDVGGGKLYVSSGLGQWAGLPMRIFNPTEISLIVLRRKGKAGT